MADVNAQPDAGKRMPTPVSASNGSTPTADISANAGEGSNGGGDQAKDGPIDADRTVEVRVLRDHGDYVANTLELVTEAEAVSGHGDWCDGHEDAIAYMKAGDA
jgi:hypothetical protein